MKGDWRADLRLKLEGFIDDIVVRGARHSAVYAAIRSEIDALEAADDKDPDPADEAGEINEPSNDWPSA